MPPKLILLCRHKKELKYILDGFFSIEFSAHAGLKNKLYANEKKKFIDFF